MGSETEMVVRLVPDSADLASVLEVVAKHAAARVPEGRRSARPATPRPRRRDLAAAIVAAAAAGTRQTDIVRITGYTREHIRRLVRAAGDDDGAGTAPT